MLRNTLLMMGISFVLAKTRDGGRYDSGQSSMSGPSTGSRYSIDNYIGVSRTAPLLVDRLMRSGYPPLDQALAGHSMSSSSRYAPLRQTQYPFFGISNSPDDLDNSDRFLTVSSATLPHMDGGFNLQQNTRRDTSGSIYPAAPSLSSGLQNGLDSYGHYASDYLGSMYDSAPISDTSEPLSMAGPGGYSTSSLSEPIKSGSNYRYSSQKFGPMYEPMPAADSGPFGPVPRLFEMSEGSDAFRRYRSATSMEASPRYRSTSSMDASPRYRSTSSVDASPRYRSTSSMDASPRYRSTSSMDASPRYRSSTSADTPNVGGRYHSFLRSSGPLYERLRVSGSEDQVERPILGIPTYRPTLLRGFDTSAMSSSGEPIVGPRGPWYDRAPLRASAYPSVGSARPMDPVGYQHFSYRARPMYGQMPSSVSDPVGTINAPVLGSSYDYSMYRSGQGASFMPDSSASSRSGPNEDMMGNGYGSSIYDSYGSSGILTPVTYPRSHQYNPSTIGFGVHLSGKYHKGYKNGR